MIVYDYVCTVCELIQELRVDYEERDAEYKCEECGEPLKRKMSAPMLAIASIPDGFTGNRFADLKTDHMLKKEKAKNWNNPLERKKAENELNKLRDTKKGK